VKRLDENFGRLLAGGARFISGTCAQWVYCTPSTRPRAYFANHASHLDLLVIWASLPRQVRRMTRPLAARDYWEKTPFRRYVAERVFNSIYLDRVGSGVSARNAILSLRNAMIELGDEYSVILFPEGTRGDGERIAEFKPGLFYIAEHKPAMEFVPVYLENLNRILPKGSIIPIPIISSISFGEPLVLRPNESKHDFLERAREAIVALKNR
jgi:1-acyl-sn-glycerol-3-phosphate acyltransferase